MEKIETSTRIGLAVIARLEALGYNMMTYQQDENGLLFVVADCNDDSTEDSATIRCMSFRQMLSVVLGVTK